MIATPASPMSAAKADLFKGLIDQAEKSKLKRAELNKIKLKDLFNEWGRPTLEKWLDGLEEEYALEFAQAENATHRTERFNPNPF